MSTNAGEPTLIAFLREAILNSGQSLAQLGRVSGVGGDRLSRFVRGERDLTLATASKVTDALGLKEKLREAFGAEDDVEEVESPKKERETVDHATRPRRRKRGR